MADGAFSPAARQAIMMACLDRCAGCQTSRSLNVQHRRARGMGGTRAAAAGSPENGVMLCGSGAHGCHGWAEAHADHARALGWRLDLGDDPFVRPFFTRGLGWLRWVVDCPAGERPLPGDWLVEPVHDVSGAGAALSALKHAHPPVVY